MKTPYTRSIGEGIDIYSRSLESQRIHRNPIATEGGVYEGGDISIGGGQVVGRLGLGSTVKSNVDRILKNLTDKVNQNSGKSQPAPSPRKS